MIDEILDLWASLRPEGTEPAAYPTIAAMILNAVRLDAMRWTLKDGKWVAPSGEVDTRNFSGIAECVEAGTVHIGFPQVTKPENCDLKPSEDLIRKLRRDSEAEAEKKADLRLKEMVERNQADLASGKTRVDPDWVPGQPAVEVDLGGGKRAFVREDKAPEIAKKKQARDAKGHFIALKAEAAASAPSPRPPRAPATFQTMGDVSRHTIVGEGHDPSFRPPIPQKPVLPEDIIGGPSLPKPHMGVA